MRAYDVLSDGQLQGHAVDFDTMMFKVGHLAPNSTTVIVDAVEVAPPDDVLSVPVEWMIEVAA
jgi:hypothetical protein